MAGGETYIVLSDGSIVGPGNPIPSQGVAGATSDVTIHGNAHPTQFIEPDADGRINEGAGATLSTGQKVTGTSGAVVQIVTANAHRSRIRIRNTSIHTVFIGNTNGVAIGTGYPLPTGVAEDFPTTSALYAVSSNTGDGVGYAEFAT